jgi:hypothetical protein
MPDEVASGHPDQKHLWDAYGHALGAAAGWELAMRIALIHNAATTVTEDEAAKKSAITKILKMTLSQSAAKFLATYPDLATDEAFVFGIETGVSMRNRLVHHFLEGAIDAFRSETGIKLLALECMLAKEHIRELERVVWANCGAIIEPFFHEPEGASQRYVDNHLLREHLKQIEAGAVSSDRGLESWGPIDVPAEDVDSD